jgi:hypothetical protein
MSAAAGVLLPGKNLSLCRREMANRQFEAQGKIAPPHAPEMDSLLSALAYWHHFEWVARLTPFDLH